MAAAEQAVLVPLRLRLVAGAVLVLAGVSRRRGSRRRRPRVLARGAVLVSFAVADHVWHADTVVVGRQGRERGSVNMWADGENIRRCGRTAAGGGRLAEGGGRGAAGKPVTTRP